MNIPGRKIVKLKMGSPIEGISTDENGAKNDVPDALPGGIA